MLRYLASGSPRCSILKVAPVVGLCTYGRINGCLYLSSFDVETPILI